MPKILCNFFLGHPFFKGRFYIFFSRIIRALIIQRRNRDFGIASGEQPPSFEGIHVDYEFEETVHCQYSILDPLLSGENPRNGRTSSS